MGPEDYKQREDTLPIHNAQPQMCSANKADRAKSRCESHCMEFVPQDLAHTGQCDLCWALVVPDSTASWFLIPGQEVASPVYVSEAAQVVQVTFKCLPGPSGLRAGSVFHSHASQSGHSQTAGVSGLNFRDLLPL